jgi:hypothetical protein
MIEIDSSRNVKFFGMHDAKIELGHKGIIGVKEYSIILDKIHNLQLGSIKEQYTEDWSEGQSRCIVIDYENKSLRTILNSSYNIPIELRILSHRLIEVYKEIDLEKDSIRISDFKNFDMAKKILPPPMPPPGDEKGIH